MYWSIFFNLTRPKATWSNQTTKVLDPSTGKVRDWQETLGCQEVKPQVAGTISHQCGRSKYSLLPVRLTDVVPDLSFLIYHPIENLSDAIYKYCFYLKCSLLKRLKLRGEQDELTGISRQLGVTAGLYDLVAGRNVRCCWLGPFWFQPQLAVVF